MQMEKNGATRFDIAKQKAQDLIDGTSDGSVYTVIFMNGSTTSILCERVEEKKDVKEVLVDLEASFGEVEYADALEMAQGYFNGNSGAKIYLITDQTYAQHDNVEIINVAISQDNYAISDVIYTYKEGLLTVSATVVAYENDATISAQLFLNGAETEVEAKRIKATANEEQLVQFQIQTEEFSSAKIVIPNADVLMEDNEYSIYNYESENAYETLLVSESPNFLTWVLESIGNARIRYCTPLQYQSMQTVENGQYVAPGGYGLYIYDGYAPDALPKDGTVWFFNLNKSIDGTGFSVQTEVELDDGVLLKLTTSSSSTAKKLTQDLTGTDLYVSKYMKYGLYGTFTTIYSYNGQPMIFTGENSYGNREVVFAFGLGDANIVMSADFVLLVRNLVEFSFPDVIEKGNYHSGERLEIHIPPACSTIQIIAPDGEISYPATELEANEYLLFKPGVYTIVLTIGDENRVYHVSASLPKEESIVTATAQTFSVQGEATNSGLEGRYDDLIILFILLSVVFMVDWAVYCYDKYQLR